MGQSCSVTITRARGRMAAGSLPKAVQGDIAPAFELQDNGDGSLTVFGKSLAGNKVDISDVATLASVSSAPNIVTADAPVGMTDAFHAVGPVGTSTLTLTATWNDGSVGPFSIDVLGTVKAGPAAGLMVEFGTPTSH